jgi:hypothetical protein
MSTLHTLTQHSTAILSQSNKTGERNKSYSNGEERSQIPLFADDVILYLNNLNLYQKILRSHQYFHQWQDTKSVHKIQLHFGTLQWVVWERI